MQQPVIIIIACARVGIWNGKYYEEWIFYVIMKFYSTMILSSIAEEVDISNVAATKIYLNYNHHSVLQLRKM